MVSNGWSERRLGDLIEVRHGWPFKSRYFSEELTGRPIVVNIGNFEYTGGFRFSSTTVKEYRDTYPEEYELKPGEILLVMTCQTSGGEILGIPARVPDDGRTYLHNQRLGRVVVKSPRDIDLDYLYWVFLWSEFNRELFVSATGTKILHTAPTRIENFQFRVPPLRDQRRIAEILGALDDKIELNRRMNETLEATARRLFRSWFVDFAPVHAKAALRRQHPKLSNAELSRRALPKMAPEIADLFPDSFDDSMLGPIPKGWKVTTLHEGLSLLETGSRPKGGVKHITDGIPSVGAESIVGIGRFDFGKTKFVSQEFFASMNKGHVADRDVLLYKDGGRPGVYEPHVSMFGDGFPFRHFCINEHVYRLRANERLTQEYIYFWLTSETALEDMRVKGTGVAIPGLNSTAVRSIITLFPNKHLVNAFAAHAGPIISSIFRHCNQTKALTTTRDKLLPKLLSGELSVADRTANCGAML